MISYKIYNSNITQDTSTLLDCIIKMIITTLDSPYNFVVYSSIVLSLLTCVYLLFLINFTAEKNQLHFQYSTIQSKACFFLFTVSDKKWNAAFFICLFLFLQLPHTVTYKRKCMSMVYLY